MSDRNASAIAGAIKNLAALSLFSLITVCAQALPVNGTGIISSNLIFGTGNANGSWTGANDGGPLNGATVEVALRGKLRYDVNGMPQNIFNYDGDRTYTFNQADSNPPPGQSIFNFEFSVNSDVTGGLNRNVNDITWLLTVDVDPSPGVFNIFAEDPINLSAAPPAFADHAFGNNGTLPDAGVEAVDRTNYDLLAASNNVAQNSFNLGFNTPGIYTISLSGTTGLNTVASTSIDIIVQAVPEPASLGLAVLALAAMTGRTRRPADQARA